MLIQFNAAPKRATKTSLVSSESILKDLPDETKLVFVGCGVKVWRGSGE